MTQRRAAALAVALGLAAAASSLWRGGPRVECTTDDGKVEVFAHDAGRLDMIDAQALRGKGYSCVRIDK